MSACSHFRSCSSAHLVCRSAVSLCPWQGVQSIAGKVAHSPGPSIPCTPDGSMGPACLFWQNWIWGVWQSHFSFLAFNFKLLFRLGRYRYLWTLPEEGKRNKHLPPTQSPRCPKCVSGDRKTAAPLPARARAREVSGGQVYLSEVTGHVGDPSTMWHCLSVVSCSASFPSLQQSHSYQLTRSRTQPCQHWARFSHSLLLFPEMIWFHRHETIFITIMCHRLGRAGSSGLPNIM